MPCFCETGWYCAGNHYYFIFSRSFICSMVNRQLVVEGRNLHLMWPAQPNQVISYLLWTSEDYFIRGFRGRLGRRGSLRLNYLVLVYQFLQICAQIPQGSHCLLLLSTYRKQCSSLVSNISLMVGPRKVCWDR